MIQPNMMMDMAIPMKLAVILWRSAKKKKKGTAENTVYVRGRAQFFYINSSD